MIISYLPGIKFIERYQYELENGQFKVLIFFLGTKFEHQFLKSIDKFSADINYLTGPHALAVAFLPPPKTSIDSKVVRLEAFGETKIFENEEEFVKAMTQSTYELARYFGVKDLPSIIFVNPQNISEVAILTIENNLDIIYRDLRKTFVNWYAKYKGEFNKVRIIKHLSKSNTGYKNKEEIEIFDNFIREYILPVIEKVFLKNVLLEKTVKRLIKNLHHQPRSTQAIQDFLNKHGIHLIIEDRKFTGDNFRHEYFRLISRSSNKLIPEFSFEEVKKFTRRTKIKKLANPTLSMTGKLVEIEKPKLNILNILTSLFF